VIDEAGVGAWTSGWYFLCYGSLALEYRFGCIDRTLLKELLLMQNQNGDKVAMWRNPAFQELR